MIQVFKNIPEWIGRMTIGYVFIESGFGKLKNLSQVTSYFQSLEIPYASIQAPMVAGLEFICGLFILVGFYTRISTLPLIGIMVVALMTAKAEDITNFSALLGQIEFLYIVVLFWLAKDGGLSFLSIDYWRLRRN